MRNSLIFLFLRVEEVDVWHLLKKEGTFVRIFLILLSEAYIQLLKSLKFSQMMQKSQKCSTT